MSYKQEFWNWVEQNIKLTAQEKKALKKAYDKAHKNFKLYTLDDIDTVKRLSGDESPELYCQFLASLKGVETQLAVETEPINNVEDKNAVEAVADIVADEADVENTDGVSAQDNACLAEESDSQDTTKQIEQFKPFDTYGFLRKEGQTLIDTLNLNQDRERQNFQEANAQVESRYIYDVATNRYCDVDKDEEAAMGTHVVYKLKDTQKVLPIRKDCFYYFNDGQQLISCACALQDCKTPDIVTDTILDTARGNGVNEANKAKAICMMPDTLGDFGDTVKSQVKRLGKNYIAVPRSIVAAYAYANGNNLDGFYCYDFDLPKPNYTHIMITKNKKGIIEFTRMERRRIADGEKYSLNWIARQYIIEFSKANGFSLSENTIDNLISTKDILRPMKNQGNIMVESTDGEYKTIKYSQKILDLVLKDLIGFCKGVVKQRKGSACLFMLNLSGFTTLLDLKQGGKQILDKISNDANAIIWKEYLPELSLEVIKDGRFEKLWLIKKDDDISSIAIKAIENDEGVKIPIKDGSFTLPKGEKEISLPLEREEFGNTVRDKKAKFSGKGLPLVEDMNVKLSLSYSYGDPDSYKLSAIGDDGFVVESTWCDDDEDKLDNICPEYNDNDQIGLSEDERSEMIRFFEGIHNKISSLIERKPMPSGYYAKSLGVSNNDKFESNLFDGMSDNQGNYVRYNSNLLKKFTETYNKSDCIDVLNEFLKSKAFEYMYDYATNRNNSVLNNLELKSHLKFFLLSNSIFGFLSRLGIFYTLGKTAKEKEKVKKLLDSIKDSQKTTTRVEYLTNASRCISSCNSSVMKAITQKIWEGIRTYEEKDQLRMIKNVSAVCWYNSNWIFDFYKTDRALTKELEKYISNYILKKAKGDAQPLDRKGVVEIRDVLEVALALCRLRELDSSIFNPKDEQTKELIAALKRIDDEIYKSRDIVKPVKSRVDFDRDEKRKYRLNKVNDSCYLLITQLRGERQLQLLGFSEE